MCSDKHGEKLGIMATLRWVFGTDQHHSTMRARNEAQDAVGDAIKSDPIDAAMAKIARMESSLDRAASITPARTLEQAMQQMFGNR